MVALPKSEYALLIAFVEAPQWTLSREQLLQATRIHEDVFDRIIDVQVPAPARARNRSRQPEDRPDRARCGVGYVFTAAVEVL